MLFLLWFHIYKSGTTKSTSHVWYFKERSYVVPTDWLTPAVLGRLDFPSYMCLEPFVPSPVRWYAPNVCEEAKAGIIQISLTQAVWNSGGKRIREKWSCRIKDPGQTRVPRPAQPRYNISVIFGSHGKDLLNFRFNQIIFFSIS